MISSASSATSKAPRAAYQRANELGRDPQPGLALLRLAQGRVDVADAMIRRVLGETADPMSRARLLGPSVEIFLAAGDTAAAQLAADELRGIAAELRTPLLRAHAARAAGAVLMADDNGKAALIELRNAFNEYHALGVRYEAARTRLLIADACEALGDHDAAEMESSSARAALESLGATTPSTTATEAELTPGRSHPTRARGARPARPRQDEPHDRHRALHQREDRRQPREPHLHQARRRLPLRRDRLRLRPRSRLTIHPRKEPAQAFAS